MQTSVGAKLHEAFIVSDNLISMLSKSCNQRRFASAGRADEGDATVRHVNRCGMEWRNSALMTQRPEHCTKEVSTNRASVRRGSQVYNNFFAGSYQKAAEFRVLEQYFFTVVYAAVAPVEKPCRNASDLVRNGRTADHDLTASLSSVSTDLKSHEGQIRSYPQAGKLVDLRFH
jgi:phage terminase large subunit-like protein